MKNVFLALAMLSVLAVAAVDGPGGVLASAHAKELKRDKAVLVTATGKHQFDVEIADNDASRARGLMFRRSLGARQGMLFLYPAEQHIVMWMRNTYIPLDMVFIAGDGTVRRIEENTETFSERTIASGSRVLAVLEINAGTAAELSLKPGDKVLHPRFQESAKQ